jgi:hypothetical protein
MNHSAPLVLALILCGCGKANDPVAPVYPTPTPFPVRTATPAPQPTLPWLTPTPTPTPTVGAPDAKSERLMTFYVEDSATGTRVPNAGLDLREVHTSASVRVALPQGSATLTMKDGEYSYALGAPGYKLATGGIIVCYAWQSITLKMVRL